MAAPVRAAAPAGAVAPAGKTKAPVGVSAPAGAAAASAGGGEEGCTRGLKLLAMLRCLEKGGNGEVRRSSFL